MGSRPFLVCVRPGALRSKNYGLQTTDNQPTFHAGDRASGPVFHIEADARKRQKPVPRLG